MFSGQYFLQMPVMFSVIILQDFLLSSADCLPFFKQPAKRIGSYVILWTSMSAGSQSC